MEKQMKYNDNDNEGKWNNENKEWKMKIMKWRRI